MKAAVYIVMLFISSAVHSVDVPLRWDAVPGAAAYEMHMSTDLGESYVSVGVSTAETMVVTNVPEDALILFRIASCGAADCSTPRISTRLYSGAWYDHRLMPLSAPVGAGIR